MGDNEISRLLELEQQEGKFTREEAIIAFHKNLMGQKTDNMLELTYVQKKRIHNLKYFTWIEQQGKELEELNRQWEDPQYWKIIQQQTAEIDKLIEKFNERVGLI